MIDSAARPPPPGGRPESLGTPLSELVRALPGLVRATGNLGVRITGVRQDSRWIEPGEVFVARRGAQSDGVRHLPQAVERGAVAIVIEDGVIPGVHVSSDMAIVESSDIPTTLAHLSHRAMGDPSRDVAICGITGTNGKTTTAHVVAAALDMLEGTGVAARFGTVEHRFRHWHRASSHTTPESDEFARLLAEVRDLGARFACIEVSSIGLEQKRCDAMHIRVAAVTNLTQDHLDYHQTMERYAAAKLRLFTDLEPEAAVVCVDHPFGERAAQSTRAPVVRVSSRPGTKTDIGVASVELGAHETVIELTGALDGHTLRAPLVGAHNVENLVVSAGILLALGRDPQRIAPALSSSTPAPGRFERCDGPGDDITVVVDYAHTPDALERALEAARQVTRGAVRCVMGCGGDRDQHKREPMGEIAGRLADIVVVTNDNPRGEDPRTIARAIEAGVRIAGKAGPVSEPDLGEFAVELDRRSAIALAIEAARAGDFVLIAGKGHEDYQIIGSERTSFDDRDEARRALASRRAFDGRAD